MKMGKRLMMTGEGGMTRSLSGGVLAGTDEPLMIVLGFPTCYLEQSNLWGGQNGSR
jgi:hypothetical protein